MAVDWSRLGEAVLPLIGPGLARLYCPPLIGGLPVYPPNSPYSPPTRLYLYTACLFPPFLLDVWTGTSIMLWFATTRAMNAPIQPAQIARAPRNLQLQVC